VSDYKGLFGRKARRRCPHNALRPIHGDEVNRVGGWRLQCAACGSYLDGPVTLAEGRPAEGEFRFIEEDKERGMVLIEATRTGNRVWVPNAPLKWPGRDG
jgi:hypothetical protein